MCPSSFFPFFLYSACGDAVLGEVTHLNLVEQYGLINEEFFFKLSMAAGEELSVGTRVSAQIHGDGIRVKSLTVLPGPPPSSVVSKVTRVDQNCLHLLDFGNPLHLAVSVHNCITCINVLFISVFALSM